MALLKKTVLFCWCACIFAGAASAEMFRDGDRVVALGDSITRGGGYHRFLADYYLTRCPDRDIRFINSGSGGDTSANALKRIESDVAARHPTVVTVMFGMNDFGFREYADGVAEEKIVNRERRLANYEKSMAALLDKLETTCGNPKLYVMTPTPFDDTAVYPNGRKVNEFMGAHAGLGRCAESVRALAAARGIPCVDFYTAVSDEYRRRRRADPTVTFASDRIHPSQGIHLLMALTFLEAQNADRVVSDVAIQDGRVTKHVKAEVTNLATNAEGVISFTLLEKSLPMPLDLNEVVAAFTNLPQLAAINQEVLTFYSLSEGDWQLKIDGRPVETASARDWALGRNLAFNPRTPQYRQAQEVQKANHRRHDRHGAICAGAASIMRTVTRQMKERGLDPNRADNRAKFLSEKLPKLNSWDVEPWKRAFADWDRHDELVRASIEEDWPKLRALAQPVPHRYELVRVPREKTVRRIWFNEDNEHFYTHHTDAEMSEEGCRKLVRTYAGFGAFKGVLYCINLQRALYDSKVWERFRDIDATLQPNYAGHVKLLSDRKVDHFAVFLDETRRQGMSAWLTMRMNDCHGLKESVKGDAKCRLVPWHTDLWEKHPEFRRAPYRDERSWEGAFDWGRPEIRERALALVREAFAKWDFDGFEFDWMRWGMYFKPGAEREGAELLNEFMREVVKIRDKAERRVGHAIALGHRVPPDPRAALNHGFDVARWAELGGVQMLTLSTFGNSNEFDQPLALWRRLLKPDTPVNVAIGRTVEASAFNSSAGMVFMRGAAAAAWAAGADGVYLFNECYMEPKRNAALEKYLHEISSRESLAKLERWTAVTCEAQVMPGDSNRVVLPMPLSYRYIGRDFSRMEQNMTMRLSAPLATAETKCTLDLAFDKDVPDAAIEALVVRVNTEIVSRTGAIAVLKRDNVKEGPENGFAPFGDGKDSFPRDAAKAISFAVPGRLLHDFYNAVEMEPKYGTPGNLVWAQFKLK